MNQNNIKTWENTFSYLNPVLLFPILAHILNKYSTHPLEIGCVGGSVGEEERGRKEGGKYAKDFPF